ncbi:MAG TPA: ATP synthase subunit I [Acidobacteriaceae bacterium]|nr:ATP synthase subunit I [Acidobacteriaceae bacterium]
MSAEPPVSPDMTDDDLRRLLGRALRVVAILTPILFLVFTFALGWQTGLLFLAGAMISWTGIWEWRSLSERIFAHLDQRHEPGTTRRTLVLFFLRLGLAIALLYVSLRCLHGTVYALVTGLGLAVVALTFEAVRFLR